MARSFFPDTHALDFDFDPDPDPDADLFPDFGTASDPNFWIPNLGDEDDPFFGSHNEGLRVTGFDSDSDYDDTAPGFGVMNAIDPDCDDDVPGFEVMNLVDSSSEDGDGMVPSGFGSEGLGDLNHEEWEEVDEGVDAAIDELFESSEIYPEEEDDDPTMEAIRALEWEILLANPNLGSDSIDFDPYLAVHHHEHEHDHDHEHENPINEETVLWHFEVRDSAFKGSPPAAKTVVESLPLVELREEGIGAVESNVVCAVCKDCILTDKKVMKLPCCHYYHPDCIVPWLSIRNTCPICRYELATSDPEYERRRALRDGSVAW